MRGVSQSDFSASEPGEDEFEISSLARALGRRKFVILGATLASVACAGLFLTLVKPRYTGEAKVLIENQESYFTRPQGGAADMNAGDSQALVDPEAIASQVQLIMSRDLARHAIDDLGLKNNPEFDSSADAPGPLSALTALLGGGGSSRATGSEDRLLEAFFSHLFVFNVGKSRVIQIEFSSRDPDLAARGANRIAELYTAVQSDAKRARAKAAAASLGGLVADLRAQVAQAEAKSEEFRANAGLTMGANNLDMVGQQLSDISAQLTVARAALAESQAKSRTLRALLKEGRLDEVSDVANNELIRRLAEQRANIKAQIASESRTLLPGHPRIKEMTAQLAEFDGQIKIAGERAARTMENDSKVAAARVENLTAAVDQQKKAVGGSSGDEARARELDREARLLKDQLESNVAKYQEAMARENSTATPGDSRIISSAAAPDTPSFPKKAPILVFSAVAGLLLSAGWVIAAELMSGRAYAQTLAPRSIVDEDAGTEPREWVSSDAGSAGRPEGAFRAPRVDIEPALGQAPANRARSVSDALRAPDSIIGLAARLAAAPAGDFAQRILVVADDRQAGAHQVGTALGRALARDRRVIMVDLDQNAGLDAGWPGFGDLQSGAASFEDAIHRDRVSRLHVLPAGHSLIDPHGERELILDALSRTYDFVLVVAPPLSEGDLALDLAPDAEQAVLATRDEHDAAELDVLRHAGAGDAIAISLRGAAAGRSAA